MKPKLLDLFCGAGGAGMGFSRAGFEVVGVDIKPQPRYPFEFHQADALEYLAEHYQEFDVIHASPPCQRYSRITKVTGNPENHPDLLQPSVDALKKTGKPYIVENVPGAPMENYLMLCGTMFGLHVFRHRLFMCNPQIIMSPMSCNHDDRSSNGGKNGDQKHPEAKYITVTSAVSPISKAKKAMGIDWMNRAELVEAIPPAYTEWLGGQMIACLTKHAPDAGESARFTSRFHAESLSTSQALSTLTPRW
ncbi:MAG: DNA cytosine methyltransferase [Anaerolineales bacterium]|nr:DNA cytosine methyltransferase [Anaerolineales bacterium]